MRHLMILLLTLLLIPMASAQIVYKSIDKEGHVIFGDKPAKHAVKVKKIVLQDELTPQQARRARKLEEKILQQQISEGNKTFRVKLSHRQLTAKIRESYAALNQATLVLRSAQKRDTKNFKECEADARKLQKNKNNHKYFLCQHASLASLEKEVSQVKQQLARYQVQLDQLPR